MIRKIALATVFAATASAALAADLPNTKGPAPFIAPPVFTWTGFYVGAQVGYAWTNHRINEFPGVGGALVGFSNLDGSGVVGGLHAGYNYQFPGTAFVLGVEGDLELSGVSKTTTVEFTPGGAIFAGVYSLNAKKDWQGSLRARLGYSFGQVLLYGTGGVAFANWKTNYTSGGVSTSFSDTHAGWTLGAGLEYAINRNWSMRGEYRYTEYRFTDGTVAAGTPFWGACAGGCSHNHRINEHAVRAGISYRF